MPTRSKNDRYIATTRPLKTVEEIDSSAAKVDEEGLLQRIRSGSRRHASARIRPFCQQKPSSKQPYQECNSRVAHQYFLSATDGQHQCEVWRRVCTIQVRPIMTLLSFAGFKVKMRPRLFRLVRKRQNSNKICLTLMTPFAL